MLLKDERLSLGNDRKRVLGISTTSMDDFARQISELQVQTQTVRCQFIEAEFETCRLALDFGTLQVELGYIDVAEWEVRSVEKACGAIVRFLPGIENQEKRHQFATQLDRVRESLHALRVTLGLAPPQFG
jgi:hypothetical protein